VGAQDRQRAGDVFVETWGVKYDKAVECLVNDRDTLLACDDFPGEHWKHLRTTNVIESSFATVRHRTVRSKGCLSSKTALAMIFKLAQAAEKSWRRLDGRQPVAEGHPRCKVHRRNRSRQIANSSRCRLTLFRQQDSAIAQQRAWRETEHNRTRPARHRLPMECWCAEERWPAPNRSTTPCASGSSFATSSAFIPPPGKGGATEQPAAVFCLSLGPVSALLQTPGCRTDGPRSFWSHTVIT
jgi:hypothetical protein